MTVIALSTNALIQAWELDHENADLVVDGATLVGNTAAAYLFGQALRTVDPLAFGTVGQVKVQRGDPVFEFPPASGHRVSMTELADALRYKYSIDPLIEFSHDLGLLGYTVGDLNSILDALNREYEGQFELALLDVTQMGAQDSYEVLGLPAGTLRELMDAASRQALLALAERLRSEVLAQPALASALSAQGGIDLDDPLFIGTSAAAPRVSLRQLLTSFKDTTGVDLQTWMPAVWSQGLSTLGLNTVLAAAREANPDRDPAGAAPSLQDLATGNLTPTQEDLRTQQLAEFRLRVSTLRMNSGNDLGLSATPQLKAGTLALAQVLIANLSERDDLVSRLSLDAGIGIDEAVWSDPAGQRLSLRALLDQLGITQAVLAALPELTVVNSSAPGLDFHRIDRLIDSARSLNPTDVQTLDWIHPWMRAYTTQQRSVQGAQAVLLRVADAVLTQAGSRYLNTPLASNARVFVDPTDVTGQRLLSLDDLGLLLTRLVGANPMERQPQWYAQDLVALAHALYAGVEVDPPLVSLAAPQAPALTAADWLGFVNALVPVADTMLGPDLLDAQAAVFEPAVAGGTPRSLLDILRVHGQASGLALAPRLEALGILQDGSSVQLRGLNTLMGWVRTQQPGLMTAADLTLTGTPAPVDAQLDFAAVRAETREDAWGLQGLQRLMDEWAGVPASKASSEWPQWQSRLTDFIADVDRSAGGLSGLGLDAGTAAQLQALTLTATPPQPFANGVAIRAWLQGLLARVNGGLAKLDDNLRELSVAARNFAYSAAVDPARQAAVQARISTLAADRAAFVEARQVIQALQAAGETGAEFEAALAAQRQPGRTDVLSWLGGFDIPAADLEAQAYRATTGDIPWFDWNAWKLAGRSGFADYADPAGVVAVSDRLGSWLNDPTLTWLQSMSGTRLPAVRATLVAAQATVAKALQANPGSPSLTAQAAQLGQQVERLDALQQACGELLRLRDQPTALASALQSRSAAFGGDFLTALAAFDVPDAVLADNAYQVAQPALSAFDLDAFWAAGEPDAVHRVDATLADANEAWRAGFDTAGSGVRDWLLTLGDRLDGALAAIETSESALREAWLDPDIAQTSATVLEDALESLRVGRAQRLLAKSRVDELLAAGSGPVALRDALARLNAATVGGDVIYWLQAFNVDPQAAFGPGGQHVAQQLPPLTWPDLAAAEAALDLAVADELKVKINELDAGWLTATEALLASTVNGQPNLSSMSELSTRLQALASDLAATVAGLDDRLLNGTLSEPDRQTLERSRWIAQGRLVQVQAVRDNVGRLADVASQPQAFAQRLQEARQALGVSDVLAYASRFDVSNYQRDQFRTTVGASTRTFDLAAWQADQGSPSHSDADLQSALSTWQNPSGYLAWLNALLGRITGALAQMAQERLALYQSLGAPANDDDQTQLALAALNDQSVAFTRAQQVVEALRLATSSADQFSRMLAQQKTALANQGLAVNDLSAWLRDFDVSSSQLAASQDEAAALSSFSWQAWRAAQAQAQASPAFEDADVALATPASWTAVNDSLDDQQALVAQLAQEAQRSLDVTDSAIVAAMASQTLTTSMTSSVALGLRLAVTRADQRAQARTEALAGAGVDEEAELRNRAVAFGDDGRVYTGAEATLVTVARVLARLDASVQQLDLTTATFTDPIWPGRALSLAELDGWFENATGFSLLGLADASALRTTWSAAELQFVLAQVNAVLARVVDASDAVVVVGQPTATLSLTGGGSLTAAAFQARLQAALVRADLRSTAVDSTVLAALGGLVNDFDQIAPGAFFSSLSGAGGADAAALQQAQTLLQQLGSPFNREDSRSLLVSELNQLITVLNDPAPASESAHLRNIVSAASDTALRFQYSGDFLSLMSQGAIDTADLTGLSQIQAALPGIQDRLAQFKTFLEGRRAATQARADSYVSVAGPYPLVNAVANASQIRGVLVQLKQAFSTGGYNSFQEAFNASLVGVTPGLVTLDKLGSWLGVGVPGHGLGPWLSNPGEQLPYNSNERQARAAEWQQLIDYLDAIAADPAKNIIGAQYAAALAKVSALDTDLAELDAARQSLVQLRQGAATSGADFLAAASTVATAQAAYVPAGGDVFAWLRSADLDPSLLWTGPNANATGWAGVTAEANGTVDAGFNWDAWKLGTATAANGQALTAYQGANIWTTASLTSQVDVSALPAAAAAIVARAQALISAVNTVRNATQTATSLPDGLLDIDALSFELPAALATYDPTVLDPTRRTQVVQAVDDLLGTVNQLLEDAALNGNRLPATANADIKTLADEINADLGFTDFADAVTKTAFQTTDFQVSGASSSLASYIDGLATKTGLLTTHVQNQITFANTRLNAYQNTLYPWSASSPATATQALQAKVDAIIQRFNDLYAAHWYGNDVQYTYRDLYGTGDEFNYIYSGPEYIFDVGGAFRSAVAVAGGGMTLSQLRNLAVNARAGTTDYNRLIELIDYAEARESANQAVPTTFSGTVQEYFGITATTKKLITYPQSIGDWDGGLRIVSNDLQFTQLSQDATAIAALKNTAATWKLAIDNNNLPNNPERALSTSGYDPTLLKNLKLVGYATFGKNAGADTDSSHNTANYTRSDSWLARWVTGSYDFWNRNDTNVSLNAYKELVAGIEALEARGQIDEAVTKVAAEKTELQADATELTLAGEVLTALQDAAGTSSAALQTLIQELTANTAPASPAVTLHDRLASYLTNHDLFAWLQKFDVPASTLWSDDHSTTSFTVQVNQWSGLSTTPTLADTTFNISDWAADPAAQSQAYPASPAIDVQTYELYRNGLIQSEMAGVFSGSYFDWRGWQAGTAKAQNGQSLTAYEGAAAAQNQATILAQLGSGQGVSLAGFQQFKTLLQTLADLLAQPKTFRDLVARAQTGTQADLMAVLEKLGVVADGRTLSRDAMSRLAQVLEHLSADPVDASLVPASDSDAFESDKNLSLDAFQKANDPLQSQLRLLEQAQALLKRLADQSLPQQLEGASSLSAELLAFLDRHGSRLDATLVTQLRSFANTGLPGAVATFESAQGPSFVPHLTFINQVQARAAAVVEDLDTSLRAMGVLQISLKNTSPLPTSSLSKLATTIAAVSEQRASFAQAARVASELLAVVPVPSPPALGTIRGETLARYQAVVQRLQAETGQDDLMSFLHAHSVPPAALSNNTYRTTFTDPNAGVTPPSYFSQALWSDTSNPAYVPQGAAATGLSIDTSLATDQFSVTGTTLTPSSLSDAALLTIHPLVGSTAWTSVQTALDTQSQALKGQLAALHARLRLDTANVADLLGALRQVSVPGGQQGFWYRLGRALSGMDSVPAEGVNLSAPLIEYPPGIGERVSFNQLVDTLQSEVDGGGQASALASDWLDELRGAGAPPVFNAAEMAQKTFRVDRLTEVKTAIQGQITSQNWASGGLDLYSLLAQYGRYIDGHLWDDDHWRSDALHWNEMLNWASTVAGADNALQTAVTKGTSATRAEVEAAMAVLDRVLLDLGKEEAGAIGGAQVALRRVRESVEAEMAAGRDDLMRLLTNGGFKLDDLDGRDAIAIETTDHPEGIAWDSHLSNPVNRLRLEALLQGQLVNDRDQHALAGDLKAALVGEAGTRADWDARLTAAINGLVTTYDATTWGSSGTANLSIRLGQLLNASELSELRSSARALRADAQTLSVLPLASRTSDLNNPADTDSRLDAAMAEGDSASQGDWLAALGELRWLQQQMRRQAVGEVLAQAQWPQRVTDPIAALTGGSWSQSDLSDAGLSVEADRSDVLLHIYLKAKAYLDQGGSTWPKEFRLAFAYGPATYGVDDGLSAATGAAAIDHGFSLAQLHELGTDYKSYDSMLAYALKDSAGGETFNPTAGRALTRTDFAAVVGELELMLKAGYRQNRASDAITASLTALLSQPLQDAFQVSDVLAPELARGAVDDSTRRVLLAAIRQAVPAADRGLVSWPEPTLNAAESRRAAVITQRLSKELAKAETDVDKAWLPSATNVELRQDLVSGGDIYVDRHGSYYINGTRTRAMDIAVTTRFLAHQNFADEYKVLMDDLAERNNLIAGARLFVDRVDSATTDATASSPALAQAAEAGFDALTTMGAANWGSEVGTVSLADRQTLKTEMESWSSATGSDDVLWDITAGRISIKDIETVEWGKKAFYDFRRVMQNFIKTESLYAPLKAQNGSVKSGDLLGELTGGKYTSDPVKMNLTKSAERMWTMLDWESYTGFPSDGGLKPAMQRILNEEKLRNGGVDVMSLATDGAYTVDNWSSVILDAAVPAATITSLKASLSSYLERGADRPLHYDGDLSDITNLLNTLISNKVRDNDLDQGKLQSITSQLQVNTEAMTALIKAFNELNSALAQALKR